MLLKTIEYIHSLYASKFQKDGQTVFPLIFLLCGTYYQNTVYLAVGYCSTSPTLSYGYGLELVQFSQQTGSLRRMESVNKLLGSPGRVEGLHELIQRMCAQVTPLHQHGERRL